MNFLRELMEQQDRPTIYVYEWSYKDGGDWTSETIDNEPFEDVITDVENDWGVEGSEPIKGIWVGLTFDQAEFESGQDEQGGYLDKDIHGVLVVISRQPLPKNHPIIGKALKEFQSAGEDEMANDYEAYKDSVEYHNDPYSYYGMKRSDFV